MIMDMETQETVTEEQKEHIMKTYDEAIADLKKRGLDEEYTVYHNIAEFNKDNGTHYANVKALDNELTHACERVAGGGFIFDVYDSPYFQNF